MSAQLKPDIVIPVDPVSTTVYFISSKLACKPSVVHEVAVIWLFHLLMNNTDFAVLNVRLKAEPTDKEHSWSVSRKTKTK